MTDEVEIGVHQDNQVVVITMRTDGKEIAMPLEPHIAHDFAEDIVREVEKAEKAASDANRSHWLNQHQPGK